MLIYFEPNLAFPYNFPFLKIPSKMSLFDIRVSLPIPQGLFYLIVPSQRQLFGQQIKPVDLSLSRANILGIYFENPDAWSLSQIIFLASEVKPINVPAQGFSKNMMRSQLLSSVDAHIVQQFPIYLQYMNPQRLTSMVARYSLVVCRHPNGRYLCVNQKSNQWWIAGGGVEVGESHASAAIRQAFEQAGVRVKLEGILSLGQFKFGSIQAFRVIYYAVPLDPEQIPKQKPDNQSKCAAYYSLQEIINLKPFWRFTQIFDFPQYLEKGGEIFPLKLFHQDQPQASNNIINSFVKDNQR